MQVASSGSVIYKGGSEIASGQVTDGLGMQGAVDGGVKIANNSGRGEVGGCRWIPLLWRKK